MFVPISSIRSIRSEGKTIHFNETKNTYTKRFDVGVKRNLLYECSYTGSPVQFNPIEKHYESLSALNLFMGLNIGNLITIGCTPTIISALNSSFIMPFEFRISPHHNHVLPLIAGFSYFNDKFFRLKDDGSILTGYFGARIFERKYHSVNVMLGMSQVHIYRSYSRLYGSIRFGVTI